MTKALILRAPGINCDRETAYACRLVGFEAELVHINHLIKAPERLLDYDFLVIPGGFSYGDHLGAGAMLATVLRHRFLGELQEFVDDGRPVLAICNGFQILARLGLLGNVSLVTNASGLFECRWVRLRVETSHCLFLQGMERLDLPVAHGQGRVVVPKEELALLLERAPLRYCENPNGSVADIAGVCNPAGNVFGLMPHPERYLTPQHHPAGSSNPVGRKSAGSPPLGLTLFQNAVRYVREVL